MGRCRKRRRIEGTFGATFFKPCGVPLSELTGVAVPVEGIEAMRLVDAEGLSQEEAARSMEVSAPTLCRILGQARSAVARALAGGMAIRIDAGDEAPGAAPLAGPHGGAGGGQGGMPGCRGGMGRGGGCGKGRKRRGDAASGRHSAREE